MIQFGVGKLSFVVSGQDDLSEEAALTKVEAALREMPNITELNVPKDDEELSFVISIPRHLHTDLLFGSRASERFRVRTMSGYDSDFTFVASLDPTEPFTGAEGVIVVREQLMKQLEGVPDVSLVTQGPSPFHANFLLSPAAGVDSKDGPPSLEPFTGTIDAGRGYASAIFQYDPEIFTNDQEALDSLQHELSAELALFYSLAEQRGRRLTRAMEIGQATQKLIGLHSVEGVKGATRRLFRSGRDARTLALAVMQAEFAVADDREAYRLGLSGTYSESDGYFKHFLDQEAADEFMPYVENGAKVVQLLESRRAKEVEIGIVAGATLLGGLAGGVVSAVLGAG